MSDITERLTEYLVHGGLYNSELMQHNKVRDLLIDCRAEIARLREERRWIPVEEKLPSGNVAVLTCGPFCGGAEMVWRENGRWHLSFVGTYIPDSTYTHWQPLPPGPEGDG